jgi:hypothetical protein
MTHGIIPARPASYDKKVGLVLQGGGALGSYQAGVYEALSSSGYTPNWVAGISIGAINAAIIAGNAPKHRVQSLRSFWEAITAPTMFWPNAIGALGVWQRWTGAVMAVAFGQLLLHGRCCPGQVHSSRRCRVVRWRWALSYWARFWPGAARKTIPEALPPRQLDRCLF